MRTALLDGLVDSDDVVESVEPERGFVEASSPLLGAPVPADPSPCDQTS